VIPPPLHDAVHFRADPPAILAPGPRQVSFGRLVARVPPGSSRAIVYVDGSRAAERAVSGTRVAFRLDLAPRDDRIRVVAKDTVGPIGEDVVNRVFGLPRAAAPHGTVGHLDPTLQRRLRRLTDGLAGVKAFYVMQLDTGRGAGWNARARFPAASTVKLAIALAVARRHHGIPPRGSWLAERLRAMLEVSSNAAANDLLVWLGGSQTAGALRVDGLLDRLGLRDSYLYSGYILGTAAARPIPANVVASPVIAGKYTTAYDLARLHRAVHLGTVGRGPLARRFSRISPREVRYLLYLLCHSADHGKLDRYVAGPDVAVPHKAGWISTARHDAGIVYWPGGAFVAAVMTWNPYGVTSASDVLAGRIARTSLRRFRAVAGRPALPGSSRSAPS